LTSITETVTGDVRDTSTIARLVDGCDVVIHLAVSWDESDEIAGIIVEGTRTVVDASRRSGVGRVLFVSCLGAEAAATSPYYRAKWEAEMLVRRLEDGGSYTILRPSLIVGRGDPVTGGMSAMLRTLPVIPVPGRGLHRVQPVDVEDFCRCLMVAAESGDLVNESVSVGGPTFVTYRQLLDLIGGRLGLVKPKLLLPVSWTCRLGTILPEPVGSLLSPYRLAAFAHGVVVSPGIIRRTFGFEPKSLVDELPSYLASTQPGMSLLAAFGHVLYKFERR